MDNEMEVYDKGRKVVIEELDKLFNKGSLSPAETEAAKTAVCLLKEMDEVFGMGGGYSERRRMSRRSYDWHNDDRMPYREYEITSYANPNPQMPSTARMNRGGRNQYSGHSINDRVVEKLENLMDSAESDYERQKIREFIRFVREDEMVM